MFGPCCVLLSAVLQCIQLSLQLLGPCPLLRPYWTFPIVCIYLLTDASSQNSFRAVLHIIDHNWPTGQPTGPTGHGLGQTIKLIEPTSQADWANGPNQYY